LVGHALLLYRYASDQPNLFVITGIHYHRVGLYSKRGFATEKKSVCYNWKFVITEFVITEFVITKLHCISNVLN
jgi:hypothetical protein